MGKVADFLLGLLRAGRVFLSALVGLDNEVLDFNFILLVGGDVPV